MLLEALQNQIDQDVRRALDEDLGSGDITAQLIPEDRICKANVYTRDPAVLCGRNWFDAVFKQLDDKVDIRWYAADGEPVVPHQVVCIVRGSACCHAYDNTWVARVCDNSNSK